MKFLFNETNLTPPYCINDFHEVYADVEVSLHTIKTYKSKYISCHTLLAAKLSKYNKLKNMNTHQEHMSLKAESRSEISKLTR